MGLDAAARAIRDTGLRVTGLCRGGMFPVADPADRARVVEDNRRMKEQLAGLNARVRSLTSVD